MTRVVNLRVSFSCPELRRLLKALVEAGLPKPGTPPVFEARNMPQEPGEAWWESWPRQMQGKNELLAEWGEWDWLAFSPDLLKLSCTGYSMEPREVLDWISRLPFEIMTFGTWFDEWEDFGMPKFGFGAGHFLHGWACAFKGPGHDRLVSRRWLEYGPWRVLRGPEDTTLIQFHDLGADSPTAAHQAAPGHERMGISDSGGFLQQPYIYTHDLRGFYHTGKRVLRIVIHGRDVSQREMRDACALRRFQGFGPNQPVDRVAFVFPDPRAAEAHLHELWLRELECRTFMEGEEVRIDVNYEPPVPKGPQWVSEPEES